MFLGSFPFRPRPQRTGESLVGLGVGGHHATLLNHEYPQFEPVLRIRDILVWIRIRGSMPLTNGSGSRRPKNILIRIRIRNTGFNNAFESTHFGDQLGSHLMFTQCFE